MIVDFIAGLLGGAAGVLVGHPFDTVKVHLQTDDPKNPKYKGTLHCMKTIFLLDSFRGLYRGISSPIMGIGIVNAIVFGVYGNIQRLTDNPNSLISHFYAGSIAGIAQSLVCAPMELAKTQLQLSRHIENNPRFKGPIDCLIYIHRRHGFKGSFNGLTATVFRDVPGFSSYFVSYELLMQLKEKPNVLYTLWAGGCAGCASWLACYPIDVVKTHMQADAHAKYNGFVDCAIKNYKKEGIKFFFRGLNSTLIRAFPMNAATFFVVSWILEFCKNNGIDWVQHSNQSLKVVNLENLTRIFPETEFKSYDELVHTIIPENSLDLSETRQPLYDESIDDNSDNYYYVNHIYESKLGGTQIIVKDGLK